MYVTSNSIAKARVTAAVRRSMLLAADVVLQAGYSNSGMEAALIRHCQQSHLDDLMIPRMWAFSDTIPMTGNFKTALQPPDKK